MMFLPLSSKLSLRRSLKKTLCASLLKLLFLQIAWIFLFLYKPSHDRPITLQIQFARYLFFLLIMYFILTTLSSFMLKISPLFGFSYVVLHLYCHIFQILILNPSPDFNFAQLYVKDVTFISFSPPKMFLSIQMDIKNIYV